MINKSNKKYCKVKRYKNSTETIAIFLIKLQSPFYFFSTILMRTRIQYSAIKINEDIRM